MSANITFIGVQTLVDPTLTATCAAGEASGGSYARQGVTWAAASGSQQANSNALTIPVPAGTFGFLTFFNNVSANGGTNYFGYAPMGGASAIKGFAVVDPTLSNADFFCDGHGLSNGNTLFLYPEFGGTLSTTLTAGTLYYVVGAATNTFQLATTLGGTAITLTVLQSGAFFWQRIVSETFNAAGNITVAIGALVLDATSM
jgi:hypothetical protein